MKKRYDQVDFNTIESKWLSETNEIGVYVHSPFCPSICNFCIYAGNLIKDKNVYSDYYDNYLPKVIDQYRNVLEVKNNQIKNWFFGGGTPSMMSAKTAKELFDRLPNFKESKAPKTFEIHPAYWSLELLDVLEEYGFDNAIVCLQTFDRKTLIKQKRVPETKERIFELTNELKKRKMHVFVDVIAHLNLNEKDDSILQEDLKLIFEFMQPEEISIQTVYQNKTLTPETLLKVFEFNEIQSGKYLIQNFNSNGISEFKKFNDCNLNHLIFSNMTLKCFRIINSNFKNYEKYLNFIDNMDPQHVHSSKANTLAIGSYKNKYTQTHSNIGNFNYIECNNDNITPIYKFVKSSFFDEMRDLIDFLEQYGEPLGNFELLVRNTFVHEKEIPLMLSFDYSNHPKGYQIQQDIDKLKLELHSKVYKQSKSSVSKINFMKE